ncbi:hypothetical protein NL529_33010, partial [Klebsiella pneumoniae]|nr:hypothetical protein [Klebsiella pneumoniae]
LGNATVAAASINPGDPAVNSGIGTSTLANLTLAPTSTLAFTLGDALGSDKIVLNNTATFNLAGTLAVTPGSAFAAGTYRL